MIPRQFDKDEEVQKKVKELVDFLAVKALDLVDNFPKRAFSDKYREVMYLVNLVFIFHFLT
jgi:hypothetical protein